MDVAAVARFLAPALPFLLKAGQEGIQRGAQALGEDVWDTACRLWKTMWPRLQERPAGREAAEDLGQRPDDSRMVSAFEVQLEKALQADPELHDAVERVWRKAATVVAEGQRNVAVGGSVDGSTIITGDHNTIGRDDR